MFTSVRVLVGESRVNMTSLGALWFA